MQSTTFAIAVVLGLVVASMAMPFEKRARKPSYNRKLTTPSPDTGIDEADGDMLIDIANSEQLTCPIWTQKISEKLRINSQRLAECKLNIDNNEILN